VIPFARPRKRGARSEGDETRSKRRWRPIAHASAAAVRTQERTSCTLHVRAARLRRAIPAWRNSPFTRNHRPLASTRLRTPRSVVAALDLIPAKNSQYGGHMTPAVLTALVASATSLIIAGASIWFQRASISATFEHDRRSRARVALERFRGPLLTAASELGDRLDNIRTRSFGDFYNESNERAEPAKLSTLFRIAQLLGWRELLRTEIQLLSFEESKDTQLAARLIGDIVWSLASKALDGGTGMLWAEEQRGIGELMVLRTDGDRIVCRGYASFVADYDETFHPWLDRLAQPWLSADAPTRDRLRLLEWALFGLVMQLDEEAAHADRAWIRRTRAEFNAARSTPSPSEVESRIRTDVANAVARSSEPLHIQASRSTACL
jgi:hypothetical protein